MKKMLTMKNALMTLIIGACWGAAFATVVEHVRTDVIPGEWTSDFATARAYAESMGVPMFVYWSNPGCSHCVVIERACNEADFVAWRSPMPYAALP